MSQPEYYPMPFFVTLAVRDLATSTRWYEALGFENVFTMPGPGGAPALVHLRWVRYADLLLRADPSPGGEANGGGIALNYTVPIADIDALFAGAKGAGASVVNEVGNRPWNARDFTLADPDGYRLTFTAGPVDRNLSFAKVIEQSARPKSR